MQNYISQPILAASYASRQLGQLEEVVLQRRPRRLSQDYSSSRQSSEASAGPNRRTRLITAIISGNNEMVFQLLYQLSDAQNRKMQHANSLFLLQAALGLSNYLALADQKINSLQRMAELMKIRSDFFAAQKFLRKALEYAWLKASVQRELELYDKLGIVHYVSGDVEKADYYHRRFAESQVENLQSPAYIVGVDNVKSTWEVITHHRSSAITSKILAMVSLLPERFRHESQPLTEQLLQNNLQLSTNQSFEQLHNVFIHSSEFLDRIESIQPLMTNRGRSLQQTPSRKQINKRIEAFDRIERIRNHSKLEGSRHRVKQHVEIPKCINIDRMIEERIHRKPPPRFDKLYENIKRKSMELSRNDRRVNLPVLISRPNRY